MNSSYLFLFLHFFFLIFYIQRIPSTAKKEVKITTESADSILQHVKPVVEEEVKRISESLDSSLKELLVFNRNDICTPHETPCSVGFTSGWLEAVMRLPRRPLKDSVFLLAAVYGTTNNICTSYINLIWDALQLVATAAGDKTGREWQAAELWQHRHSISLLVRQRREWFSESLVVEIPFPQKMNIPPKLLLADKEKSMLACGLEYCNL